MTTASKSRVASVAVLPETADTPFILSSPLLAQLDPDGLHVGEAVDLLKALFAAIAAHPVSAEGHCRVQRAVAVHVHRSGADVPGEAVGLADVAGPDAAGQAVAARVRAPRHFIEVIKGHCRHDRAEDLLAGNA